MVRIWLGDHLIAEYVAEPDRASRYQRVMTPKFTGLRITVDNTADGTAPPSCRVSSSGRSPSSSPHRSGVTARQRPSRRVGLQSVRSTPVGARGRSDSAEAGLCQRPDAAV